MCPKWRPRTSILSRLQHNFLSTLHSCLVEVHRTKVFTLSDQLFELKLPYPCPANLDNFCAPFGILEVEVDWLQWCYYSPTLKKWGLYRIWVVCHSVCLSVCSSFIIFRFPSISWEILYRIYQNFVCALILTRLGLGLLHVIFGTFVTELWPLIYTIISFPFNILRTNGQNLTKFYICIHIDKIYLGIFAHLYQSYGPWFMPKICFRSLSWEQN